MERYFATHLLRRLEGLRREPPTVSPYPVRGVEDYSGPGSALTLALTHLDEALPSGQRQRAVHAAMLAQASLSLVLTYMHAAGYFDPTTQETSDEKAV